MLRTLRVSALPHFHWVVTILVAMVLAITVACESELKAVEVKVVEEVEMPASAEIESPKTTVQESDAASSGSESSPVSSSSSPTTSPLTPTPYPTLAPAQLQAAPDRGENIGPDLVRQPPDDTPNPDNAIIAADTGLSIEEVNSAIAFQNEFGDYARQIREQFPEQISAVWMDSPPGTEGPNTRGHIRFTGAIPTDIKTLDNVVLTGEGLISETDHKRRGAVAARALRDLGFNNFLTFYDPREDVIRIELLLTEGAIRPSKSEFIPEVRRSLGRAPELQGRAALLEATDIELTVLRGDGPILIIDNSNGDD